MPSAAASTCCFCVLYTLFDGADDVAAVDEDAGEVDGPDEEDEENARQTKTGDEVVCKEATRACACVPDRLHMLVVGGVADRRLCTRLTCRADVWRLR